MAARHRNHARVAGTARMAVAALAVLTSLRAPDTAGMTLVVAGALYAAVGNVLLIVREQTGERAHRTLLLAELALTAAFATVVASVGHAILGYAAIPIVAWLAAAEGAVRLGRLGGVFEGLLVAVGIATVRLAWPAVAVPSALSPPDVRSGLAALLLIVPAFGGWLGHVLASRSAAVAHVAATRRELRGVNARIADLLGAASHGIRTPLSAIAGAAEALDEGWERLDERRRGVLLGLIRRSAQRALLEADDIHTRARIAAATLEVTPMPVHASELISRTVAATATALAADLHLDVEEVGVTTTDPTLLAPLVANLVRVGVAASEEPSLRVRRSHAHVHLELTADLPPPVHALPGAADAGTADHPLDHLDIVRLFAERLGGRVLIDRRRGLDTVTVDLPLEVPVVATATDAGAGDPAAGASHGHLLDA